MNTHKQILMTMTAAVLIAAAGIFAGCKKDDDKVKATGVTVCPTDIMLEIGKTVPLLATVMPSNADNHSVKWTSTNVDVATVNADGVVTALDIGEATVTCTTNDGGFTDKSIVIVNALRNDNDYATLVPGFYFGNMMMDGETVGENNRITVRYNSKNKAEFSINESFKVPLMGDIEVPMNVYCTAGMTKNGTGYKAEGKTTASMMGMSFDVDIEAIFDGVDKVDMTIYVYKIPMMGDIVINFTGMGTTEIDPCFLPD